MLNDNTEMGMVGLLNYLAGTIEVGKEDALRGDTLEQKGDIVVIRSKRPYDSEHPNINVFIFDLSKGGLCVSREYIGPAGTRSCFDGTLIQTNGVWHYAVLEQKINGTVTHKITLTESAINKPIDDTLFTLRGFGAKQGCLITDTIRGTASVVTDSSYPVPVTAKSLYRFSYTRVALVTIGLLLIITSIISFVIKKMR